MTKRIGILTAGNDVPGLNAAIRAIGKTAQGKGFEIIGFQDGFKGLVNNQIFNFQGSELSGILTKGGTLLGTSQDLPDEHSETNMSLESAVENYKKNHLDALVILGGVDMQNGALKLAEQGLNIVSLPKSIANDLQGTDFTIGFDTALSVSAEAIDRLHSTAHSHHRIIIVEIIGRHVGWLTLGAGIAGGADVILIPEIPYNILSVAKAIQERNKAGKRFSIIAVSEGALTQENLEFFKRNREINRKIRQGKEREKVNARLSSIEESYADNTNLLAHLLSKHTGLETRTTILGFLLRGGVPSALDRLRATQIGTSTIEYIQTGQFGIMLGFKGNEIVHSPLAEIAGKHKLIPETHNWILSAREVGTCFGDQ